MSDATTLVLGDTGDRTEVVVVEGDVTVVSEAADATVVTVELAGIPIPGPQGPQGPAGLSGSGGSFYTTVVATPVTSLVVDHNLGRVVTTTLLTAVGDEVDADVVHQSLNRLTVTFAAGFTGTVHCI